MNDGGNAFPQVGSRPFDAQGSRHLRTTGGMSLRDYFAAKIAAAFCAGPDGGLNPTAGKDTDWKQATARTAYELADAMLAARSA